MSEIGDDPIWKFALLMERGMLLSRNNWSVESAAWRRALARYRLACVPGKDDDLKTHLGNSVRYETIDSCLGVLSPPPEYLRPRSISSPWNRNFYRRHCLSHPTFFSNMEFHPKPFRLFVIITNPSLSPLLEAIAVERNGSESTIVYLIATWLERELNWLISPRTARKIVARFRPIFFQSNHFRDKCQSYRVKGQHPSPCVDLTTSSSLCALLGRAVEFGTRERYSTQYPRGIEEFTWEIRCYVDPLTHASKPWNSAQISTEFQNSAPNFRTMENRNSIFRFLYFSLGRISRIYAGIESRVLKFFYLSWYTDYVK